jgi:hypothetical protein
MKPHTLHTPHIGQVVTIHWLHTTRIDTGYVSYIASTWFDVRCDNITYSFKKSSLHDINNCAGTAELGERNREAEARFSSLIARS